MEDQDEGWEEFDISPADEDRRWFYPENWAKLLANQLNKEVK